MISNYHTSINSPLSLIVRRVGLVELSTRDLEVLGSSRGDATFSTRNFLGQGNTV